MPPNGNQGELKYSISEVLQKIYRFKNSSWEADFSRTSFPDQCEMKFRILNWDSGRMRIYEYTLPQKMEGTGTNKCLFSFIC